MHKLLLGPAVVAGLVAACLAAAGPAAAASQTVLIGTSFYDPQTVTIDQGDAITWSVGQGRHTVSSTMGAFDSGPLAEGQTFSFTFPNAGTFTYRDRLNPGVATGNVIVQAVGNVPPVAHLTASASSAPAGTAITFDARGSSDPDGAIARYQWDFDGDGAYETDTGTTPTIARTFPNPGTIPVGLLVTDGRGSSAVATPVAITVTRRVAPADTTPPDLTYLGARPQHICVRARHGCRGATRVTLQLGEAATLRVKLERFRAGRRPLVVRSSSRAASRGKVAVLQSAHGLAPGRYRLTITAVDKAGNRSASAQPRLTVAK